MTDLRLIDAESLTFYCYGCHEHTQNVNHTCEGQVDLMVKRAEQMLGSADVIHPPKDMDVKEFKEYVDKHDWDINVINDGAIEFKRIDLEDLNEDS
jgi:hypothetical protein